MKTIYLHGTLADKFGESFCLDVKSPAEAFRALCSQCPGFMQETANTEIMVLKGKPGVGVHLEPKTLHIGFGKVDELHILPAVSLGKKAGTGKFLVGIFMIAASFAIPAIALGGGLSAMAGSQLTVALGSLGSFGIHFSTIAMFGLAFAAGGLSQMLAPTPKTAESGDQNKSYLMNGAPQLYEQGNPVPLAYGLNVMCGTVVIASAMITYDMSGVVAGYQIDKGVSSPVSGGVVGTPVNSDNDGVQYDTLQKYFYAKGQQGDPYAQMLAAIL